MAKEGCRVQMVVLPIDENSVIQGCLVGLGLLFAIYTLVYPYIRRVLDDKVKAVLDVEKDIQKETKQLSEVWSDKKLRTKSIDKLKKLDDDFGIEYEGMPFELYLGFILTLGLFSIPLVIYILSFFGVQIILDLLPYVLHFYFVGILLFILLFILIFFRLNSFLRSDFDEKVANAREAASKELEKVKVTHKKEFSYDAIITDPNRLNSLRGKLKSMYENRKKKN